MYLIERYKQRKDLRKRFASDEQFQEEYLEGYEKELYVAFILIKEEIDINIAESMTLVESDKHRLQILKDFIEQDVERAILEGEEDD